MMYAITVGRQGFSFVNLDIQKDNGDHVQV